MSSENDIENAYKEMLKQAGETVTPSEESAASRSLADDLIDAVAEPEVRKKILTCPSCSSTEFTSRGGLNSSTRINVCTKCGTKIHTKKKKNFQPAPTHGQGQGRGPTWSSRQPKEPRSKFTPKFKLKSKPRKKDE